MPLANPLKHAFGLDIGDRSFKLTQVSRSRNGGGHYRLTAWGSVDVPEGVMERGEIVDPEKATECLKRLLVRAKGRLRGRATVGCLPEARSFVKVMEINQTENLSAIQKEVAREIEQNIPLPTEEIYHDWQSMGRLAPTERADAAVPPEGEGDEKGMENGKMRIMLAAAPRKLVDGYVNMMEAAGLAPIALEVEATAITRAMIPTDDATDEPIGILDIGATRSSLIVCDRGAMRMSISIPLSGNELTEIISERLGINLTDAERVKVECGLDAHRCEDRMWSILLPLIDDMSNKIRNALRFYRIGFPDGKKIERIALCGGGANFRDIDTVLSRKLTIKARRGNALANVDRLPKGFSKDLSLTYATAIGLAIRAAEESRNFHRSFRI
ncbi:pilus assembly protein PilM [Candidatus Uhrbacteria bacterium]|nr:pilus assembly protein PilM [Candidatus Uhrbacteria bacterium]